MVLATPVQLHEKIQKMKDRVRDLEMALREVHSFVSPEGHPLLVRIDQENSDVEQICPNLDKLPSGSDGDGSRKAPHSGTHPETGSTDGLSRAFGTLTISPGRGSKVCVNVHMFYRHHN